MPIESFIRANLNIIKMKIVITTVFIYEQYIKQLKLSLILVHHSHYY